jgi:outer membrane protein assembly factor BamD
MRSLALLATVVSLLCGGCGMFGDAKPADETANMTPSQLYQAARDAMSDGSYDKAIKYFEKLESRYPYGRYAQQSQLEIAYAYFKQGESTSAISACDRFIRLHPNHPSVDYAYYLKGLINFNDDMGFIGKLAEQEQSERDPKAARESFLSFKELVGKFPESKYAPDATARMAFLLNALASHEVFVAKYYLKRGAYVAAVNRAQDTMRTYPEAPANEAALFILVQSYDALGMKELRDDAERVMRKNFPKSTYYEAGLDRPEPWWKLW